MGRTSGGCESISKVIVMGLGKSIREWRCETGV